MFPGRWSSRLLLARFAIYAPVACLASLLQFGFFDCNGVKALSFATGALTVLLGCVVGDRLVAMRKLPYSQAARVALGAGVAILGAVLVVALGGFTIFTHMCG